MSWSQLSSKKRYNLGTDKLTDLKLGENQWRRNGEGYPGYNPQT